MPRIERNLFFVDTETTGLDPTKSEILQVAVILTDPTSLKVIEKYQARLKPLNPDRIDPKAAAVNGYKAEDYTEATCAPRAEVASNLCRIMKGALPVGQNIKFDVGFIDAFLRGENVKPTWHYHSLDTMNLAWPFFQAKKIDAFNLDALCALFKVERPAVHSAVADIEATYKVYLELMRRLTIVD
jgi:DNA polymerase-3 subunit epsilon